MTVVLVRSPLTKPEDSDLRPLPAEGLLAPPLLPSSEASRPPPPWRWRTIPNPRKIGNQLHNFTNNFLLLSVTRREGYSAICELSENIEILLKTNERKRSVDKAGFTPTCRWKVWCFVMIFYLRHRVWHFSKLRIWPHCTIPTSEMSQK